MTNHEINIAIAEACGVAHEDKWGSIYIRPHMDMFVMSPIIVTISTRCTKRKRRSETATRRSIP